MTTRTLTLEAELSTTTTALGITAQSVVALPSTSLDTPGFVRLYLGGALTLRRYDDELEQP